MPTNPSLSSAVKRLKSGRSSMFVSAFIQTMRSVWLAKESEHFQADLRLRPKHECLDMTASIVGSSSVTDRSKITWDALRVVLSRRLTLTIANDRKRDCCRRTLRCARKLIKRPCSRKLLELLRLSKLCFHAC